MQILTNLWAIQKWFRTQKAYTFYSTSILIVYDARKLRQVLELHQRQNMPSELGSPTSPSSESQLNSNNSSSKGTNDSFNTMDGAVQPKTIYRKIQRSHSSINNYEQVSYKHL
jgi:inositol-polyphosphate multikinase